MIYENKKIEALASEVTGYLQKYSLGEAYIESFRERVPAGMRIPGIKEVLGNHQLRNMLMHKVMLKVITLCAFPCHMIYLFHLFGKKSSC